MKYHLKAEAVPALENLGVKNLVISDDDKPFDFGAVSSAATSGIGGALSSIGVGNGAGGKPFIVGNIRMGFGHYRISIALASAARSMGYTPYWFDLHSFQKATAGKIIAEQNKLYSLGSRLSQNPAFSTSWFGNR